MASAKIGYRGNAIAISAGLGIALPLAAYAATLPVDGVSDVVRADAMPFAAGVLAGVGMLALTGHLLDRHAERIAAEEAEAAQFTSIFSNADAVVPRTAGAKKPAGESAAADAAAPRGKRFNRGAKGAGVPVISRGVDALDEMEAWAEIDGMLSEDSPFSCDPARSKDMYQIALEELMRSEFAGERAASSPMATGPSAAARAGSAHGAPTPEQTSAFLRAMGVVVPGCAVAPIACPAEGRTGVVSVPASDALTAQSSVPAVGFSAVGADTANAVVPAQVGDVAMSASGLTPEQQEASQDREAAIASLYGESAAPRMHTPVLPNMSASAPALVTEDRAVSMADYSGHESMWARALAIMEELDASQASVEPPAKDRAVVAAEISLGTGPASKLAVVGDSKTAFPTASLPASSVEEPAMRTASVRFPSRYSTTHMDPARMAAIAEGGNATRLHSRVNAMLEEEIEKIPSKSVHRTAHEYLKVIEGGTASMPMFDVVEA